MGDGAAGGGSGGEGGNGRELGDGGRAPAVEFTDPPVFNGAPAVSDPPVFSGAPAVSDPPVPEPPPPSDELALPLPPVRDASDGIEPVETLGSAAVLAPVDRWLLAAPPEPVPPEPVLPEPVPLEPVLPEPVLPEPVPDVLEVVVDDPPVEWPRTPRPRLGAGAGSVDSGGGSLDAEEGELDGGGSLLGGSLVGGVVVGGAEVAVGLALGLAVALALGEGLSAATACPAPPAVRQTASAPPPSRATVAIVACRIGVRRDVRTDPGSGERHISVLLPKDSAGSSVRRVTFCSGCRETGRLVR